MTAHPMKKTTSPDVRELISHLTTTDAGLFPEHANRIMKEAADVLSLQAAMRSHPQAVAPEGWVLVPKEPTREMWAASGDAQMKRYNGFNYHHDVVSECVWSAMLAAAPQPTASDKKEGE